MHGQATGKTPSVPVWDLGVRLFHWALAASIFTALGLGLLAPPRFLGWHLYAGYAALALVIFRLVWGMTGTTFARFRSFPPSPKAVLAHLRGGHAAGYGHNPLGALMVYGLLAVILMSAATGLTALGGLERQGVLAPVASVNAGEVSRLLHQIAGYGLIAMIAAHLGGVIFQSRREKENLARAMLTGKKRQRADPAPRVSARPVETALLLGLTAAVLAAGAFWLSTRPQPAQPSAEVLPLWQEECGACHSPHHPALLPAADWAAIMAALDDHFGEDASLDAASTEAVSAWLSANSSEHFDTKAALWFRDAGNPPRVTATARWKAIHEDIPSEAFKAKPVFSAANCAACHGDALQGRFARQSIRIPETPKETK